MENSYFKSANSLIKYCKKKLVENNFKQSIYFGKIVTGEAFITQSGREEIIAKYNPLCVDMETASVAHVCYVNKIPFLAIRSITDTEEECGMEAFEENCVQVSLNSIEILKALMVGFL